VAGNISMAFLEPVVLLNVVQIIPSDDDGPLHFGGLDDAFQNAASNMDIAGERALLIHVHTIDGSGRGLEAQANIFVVAQSLTLLRFSTQHPIVALSYCGLLLERPLRLFRKFRHPQISISFAQQNYWFGLQDPSSRHPRCVCG